MTHPAPRPLDTAVARALLELAAAKLESPRVLISMATGLGLMPERIRGAQALPLAELGSVPRCWRTSTLYSGRLGNTPVWLIEDATTDPADEVLSQPWEAGFPIWLAARAGASLLVHASAGAALPREREEQSALAAGELAVLRDHINFSGAQPLLGLGSSELGPLFPDLTQLYHLGLRSAALRHAEQLGWRAREAVAACTLGPSLETPSERAFLARAGADLSVQGLCSAVLPAAHAGLSALCLCVVTDAGDGGADVGALIAHAQRAAPRLEELLLGLAGELAAADKALRSEREVRR